MSAARAKYPGIPSVIHGNIEPLLIDVVKDGQLVCDLPTIEAMRANRRADMNRLDAGVRRLLNHLSRLVDAAPVGVEAAVD